MPAVRRDDTLLRLVKEVGEIRRALRSISGNIPLFDLSSENAPAQITGNQNNYNIGNADVLRLTSDAARTITGFTGGLKGRFLQVFNAGSFTITLAHQSASSTAANRFLFSGAQNVAIPSLGSVLLYYDSTQSRWIDTSLANGYGGLYTPALTNTTNLTASTVYGQFMYIRSNNIFSVGGVVDADPLAAGACQLDISLPFVPAAPANSYWLSGVGANTPNSPASIIGGTGGSANKASMLWTAPDGTNRFWRIVLMYVLS